MIEYNRVELGKAARERGDMSQITFSIPDEVLYDTKMSHEQAKQFARQAVALSYYIGNCETHITRSQS